MIDQPENRAAPLDPDVTRAQPSSGPAAETIGPYRLLQQVGEGGMGEVWLAEQTRPVRRQVALKVIKTGMDTAQVVARFEAERQALAMMDHPAIARVFDAGMTPQGRPYFVMEYVRGEAITGYAIRHKLSIRDRIDLFMQVCEGVQHAHQKGIIHRDLKPSNILVTVRDDHPVPKIIDFGVAKATTQPLTERTLHTEFGALVGTPEYMSPEQAEMSGLDIDTRTDVYALGVTLYELLTGTLPFEAKALREKGLDEIRRTIREVDPPRPSARVARASGSATATSSLTKDGERLASQLRGDLDWITMKALEKDRTRRYGTVGELAADLQRHLENQPVLASPPSTMYRVQKFVRRNRFAVAAATTVLALLVAFAATMAVQARRIALERDRANREAATVKQVSDFLVGLFNVSDPSEARGSTLTAREILDKGAKEIEQGLRIQPDVQARLQTTIGTVYTNLGLYSAAEPPLQQAVATLRRTVGQNASATLAASHQLANLYWYEERYADAEPLYLLVVEGRMKTLGAEHRDTLKAKFDLASLYFQKKRWDDFEPLARTTLDTQRRVLGETDLDTISSMNNLASMYYSRGRYAEALPIHIRVLDVRIRVLGEEHPETLNALHNLATVYSKLERFGEAEPLFLKALAAERRVLGAAHPMTIATLLALAHMDTSGHRYSDAESLLLGALAALPESQQQTSKQRITRELATLYDASGQPAKAAEWRSKLPKDTPSRP